MEQSYTQENLVQFIYRDTSITEYFEIDNAIENDSVLKKQYLRLYNAFKSLPKVTFSPRENTINSILNYSQNYVPRVSC